METGPSQLIYPEIIYELAIETTKLLNERQDELKNITWNDGEANIDTGFSILACNCCKIAWETVIVVRYPIFKGIEIICIGPDIKITFMYPDGGKMNCKIEMKSSKNKTMPGSTIKKLDINQSLIYCLRPSSNQEPYELRCSQYYSAMGESETDLFQDRTPRPLINFDKMNATKEIIPFLNKDKKNCWVEHYAKCALNRVNGTHSCQHSWQDDMVNMIKKDIIEEYIRKTSEHQFQIDKNHLQDENTNN
jgi:hypothetical protein